ncbi:MAG: ferritin-like domain-containing protein [Actinomycetota bacterium]
MSDFTLEELDQDGAFCDALERVQGPTRAEFLRKAVVGGGTLLAALAAPPREALAKTDDISILNFDLTFEYLQATFYTETERVGTVDKMRPEMARWARVFGAHERAHVKILKDVLGDAGVKKPFFNFQGVTEDPTRFARTAVAMEDLTTALLAGQAPRINSRALVAAIFSLLTVEARHAAWVRNVVGFTPVVSAFDDPKSLTEVGRVVNDTNFIASRPQTQVRGAPRFTG